MYKRFLKSVMPFLLVILIVSGCVPMVSDSQAVKDEEYLSVHFIDVGQGDAIYIHYKDFDMLIDGGDSKSGDLLVKYLKKQNFKDLDLVVATHPHADHIGGLDDVIRQFQVKAIVDSGAKPASQTSAFTNYQKAVQAEKAIYKADQNKLVQVDNFLKVEVIEMGDQFDELNDESVIVKLTYKSDTALFTGDAETLIESKLLKKVKTVGLFKAAHHGSNTSNSEAFLKLLQPQWIVISCGKDNEYKHPHEDVVARFKKYGKKIFSTSDNGHIVMKTEGRGWSTTAKKGLAADNQKSEQVETTKNLEKNKLEVAQSNGLRLKSLNVSDELVVIENSGGKSIDLKGYVIFSTVGSQKFILPEWQLKPGEMVSVASGSSKGQLKWTDENLWNNSGDTAELYTPEGLLIDRIIFKK